MANNEASVEQDDMRSGLQGNVDWFTPLRPQANIAGILTQKLKHELSLPADRERSRARLIAAQIIDPETGDFDRRFFSNPSAGSRKCKE